MRTSNAPDDALALALGAYVVGLVGWLLDLPGFVITAFVLTPLALVVLATDDRHEPRQGFSVALAIAVGAVGVAVVGYVVDSTSVTTGGYALAVISVAVAIGEGWAWKGRPR